jgi:hypothetical protein
VWSWLFILACWALGVMGVLMQRRSARRLTRTVQEPRSPLLATFRGSMRSRQAASGAAARLEFFDWGIRVRSTRPFRSLLPAFEVRYNELTDAQLVSSRSRRGIRFRSDCLPEPVTFTSQGTEQIVSLLQLRGVPINRESRYAGGMPGD